jgi:hypothetical protein
MSDEAQGIRDMAESDAAEAAEELFPTGSLDGDNVTLGQIIRPGEKVEVTVSMRSAQVPMPRGGLLDPRKEHMLLVTTEVDHMVPAPKRDGDRVTGKTVEGWGIRQVLRPIYLERVKGEEGAIEASFADLLKADASRAAALLDRLRTRTESALGAAV